MSFIFDGLQLEVGPQGGSDRSLPVNDKGSVIRAASALAGGAAHDEDIRFVPRKAWTKQPNTPELLAELEDRRHRFGWEVDFEDFEMPFQKNISAKVKELNIQDEGD